MNTNTKKTSPHRFIALERSLQLVAALVDVVAMIRRFDSALADQIDRASASVPANLGEGSRRRGKDRMHFYRMASGSADEVRRHLMVAVARSHVSEKEIVESEGYADEVCAMLWRITER